MYTCYLKEDKSHLDNIVCEEENGQYGCMYQGCHTDDNGRTDGRMDGRSDDGR
jgi:hypothetical protein